MAPKKVSGAPLAAGEEPLTAVLLADSFTQVSLKGGSVNYLIQKTSVALRHLLRICWLYSRASHEEHREWHCPGRSTSLQSSLHGRCINKMPHNSMLA